MTGMKEASKSLRHALAAFTVLALVALPVGPAGARGSHPTIADLGTSLVGWYMALDPAHHHVFVEQPEANRLRVYAYGGRRLATLRLPSPGQMTLAPAGRLLYVVTMRYRNRTPISTVTAVSTRTLTVRWRMRAQRGRCLSGVAAAAGRVWSTSGCGAGLPRLVSFAPGRRGRGWARSGVSGIDSGMALERPRDRGHLLAGEHLGCDNCALDVWHVNGRHAQQLGSMNRVNGVAEMQFTADGRRLALAGTIRDQVDGADVVRPRDLGGRFTTYQNPDFPTAAIISPSGNHLVEGNADGLALYAKGDPRVPVRSWRSEYVHQGDLVVTPDGRWMFDVVWTINSWDGCSCHPPHYLLQARRLGITSW